MKTNKRTYWVRMTAVLLVFVFLAGLLTGCRTEYSKRDIHKYIRETLKLTDYRITRGPEDQTNPEDYRDEWWTVTTDEFGLDEPLTFHVINHMTYSTLWATNYLTDDLNGQLFIKLAEDYSRESGIPYIRIPEDDDSVNIREIIADSGMKERGPLYIVLEEEYIQYPGNFYYPLKTRSDFEAPLDAIADFQAYVSRYPALSDMDFSLCYYLDSDLPEKAANLSQNHTAGDSHHNTAVIQPNDIASNNSGVAVSNESESDSTGDFDPALSVSYNYYDYSVSFNSKTTYSDFHNAVYSYGEYSYQNGAVYEYLADALLYGLKDRIAEFSEEEIETLIQMNVDLIPIRDYEGNAILPTAVYASTSSYIPLGHLYDLLLKQNIPVTGSWKHFSFTGKDGVNYELGYDMPPLDPDDWYGYSYQVTVEDAAAMLGMEVDNGFPTYEVTIPSSMISEFGMDASALLQEMQTATEGDIRDLSLEADGIHVTGKALQFNKIERANEDRIRAIEEEVDPYDVGFYANYNHMSKSYEGIRFRFLSNDIDIPSNQDLFNEMVCRTVINSLLDNPEDPEWYCTVEFVFGSSNETEEKTEFRLPEEMSIYRDYLRNGPESPSSGSEHGIGIGIDVGF